MQTPWGTLDVADAHVHFFTRRFFSALAAQKKVSLEALAPLLDWQLPADDPLDLAADWIAQLDRHGVARAAITDS